MTADPPIVIFLPLLKACGTTLTKPLLRWFTPEEVFPVDRRKPADLRSALEARARQNSPPLRLIGLHAASELDADLWAFAQQRLRALVAGQDEGFAAELARLRRANRRAETVAGVMRRFKPARLLAR